MFTCTLTYGKSDLYQPDRWEPEVDHWRARSLVYEDVREWSKRMRNHSKGFRFFVCGEYAPLKGRSHWHVAAFFEEPPPNLKFGERYVHWAETPEQAEEMERRYKRGSPLWSHGWSWWEEGNPEGLAYVCKYLLKDQDYSPEETEKSFGLSKLPPLGWKYLSEDLAVRYVGQGLSPQKLEYGFDDVFEKRYVKGGTGWQATEVRSTFQLLKDSASKRLFCDAFIIEWVRAHGNDRWPVSELIDGHVDDMERRARRARGAVMFEEFFDDDPDEGRQAQRRAMVSTGRAADRTWFQFDREFLVYRLAKRGIVLPYYAESRERDVYEDMNIRRDVLFKFAQGSDDAAEREMNAYAVASHGT